jgi:hypothetical protein
MEKNIYKDTNYEYDKPIVKELKNKYDVLKVIRERYDNDEEVLNFYNTYYQEIEDIEYIGLQIWKIFGLIWNEEKQDMILNLLTMTLALEKVFLKIKKSIIDIHNKKKEDQIFKEDYEYLVQLVEKIRQDNNEYININCEYSDLQEKYTQSRIKFQNHIEEEYTRLVNKSK